jgi:hypothetical protein
MLRLAPEIQHHILWLPESVMRPMITERALRPIAQVENLKSQEHLFQDLLALK